MKILSLLLSLALLPILVMANPNNLQFPPTQQNSSNSINQYRVNPYNRVPNVRTAPVYPRYYQSPYYSPNYRFPPQTYYYNRVPYYNTQPNLRFPQRVPQTYQPYAYQVNPTYRNHRLPPPPRKKKKKAWGDVRNIWPDFYTEFTEDIWDKSINGPYDLGYMPGGWRFPSFSSPDPVTVGDAVANQAPPFLEEIPNFMNFSN